LRFFIHALLVAAIAGEGRCWLSPAREADRRGIRAAVGGSRLVIARAGAIAVADPYADAHSDAHAYPNAHAVTVSITHTGA
jgi:hypothetical protein